MTFKVMGKLYTKKVDEEKPAELIEEKVEEKKPVNEKKLLALEKARQRRQEKKLEKEAAAKALVEQEEAKKAEEQKEEEAKLVKKQAAAEKRKAKKMMPTPEPSVASIEPEVQPETKRKRPPKEPKERVEKKLKADPLEPPKWFTTFLEGVKKEQVQQSGEKITKAEMKAEVQETAQKKWNDGYTRDMIQNQQDKHLTKMYSMMFNGRKL